MNYNNGTNACLWQDRPGTEGRPCHRQLSLRAGANSIRLVHLDIFWTPDWDTASPQLNKAATGQSSRLVWHVPEHLFGASPKAL